MNSYDFRSLDLKVGELITLTNEKGEGVTGTYKNDYDNSHETFKVQNYSNGRLEVIKLSNVQYLSRI